MLDPLTALGLASNIAQLVQTGLKAISTSRELASKGTTRDIDHLSNIAAEISRICAGLSQNANCERTGEQTPSPEVESEKVIGGLATTANSIANELSTMLRAMSIEPSSGNNVGAEVTRQPKRRRLTVGRTFKAMWNEKEVQALRTKLQDLQQTMILKLAIAQSTAPSKILKSSRDDPDISYRDNLTILAQHEKQLHSLVNKSSSDVQALANFEAGYILLAKEARIVINIRQVLRSLVFEEIHDREINIPEAHQRTYAWIFHDDTLGFSHWASQSNGLYWVTGKPGSGKSTLMKYLVHNSQMHELLNKWAHGHDSELVFAHHYFWSAGTKMQKSQSGLLRTLLYQLAVECPEIVIDLVPDRFKAEGSPLPWTTKELFDVITAFSDRDSHCGKRLCFFIDGLDEYAGEHADLVELVTNLSRSVKLCVSSRPWNVYTRAYNKRVDGQLALHELTKIDIQIYIRESMSENHLFQLLQEQDPTGTSELIRSITSKAQGVFLWVHLVVRSLLRGLTNGDDIEVLLDRVRDYPETLDAYYHRMFDRIEKVYHRQSSRLMLTALLASEQGRRGPGPSKLVPLWTPSCLELEPGCPDYAQLLHHPTICGGSCDYGDNFEIKGKCLHQWTLDLFQSYTGDRAETLKRYLDARCADFLTAGTSDIQFIHRTARDFLEENMMLTLYERAGPNYDVALSLARVRLMDLKSFSDSAWSILNALIYLAGAVRPRNVRSYLTLLEHISQTGADYGVRELIFHIRREALTARSMTDRGGTNHAIVKLDGSDKIHRTRRSTRTSRV